MSLRMLYEAAWNQDVAVMIDETGSMPEPKYVHHWTTWPDSPPDLFPPPVASRMKNSLGPADMRAMGKAARRAAGIR